MTASPSCRIFSYCVSIQFLVLVCHNGDWLSVFSVQLTCLNIAYVMIVILQTTDTSDGVWPREWMQEAINGGIVSSLTLPMFALIPALACLLAYRQPPRNLYGVCLLASVATSVLVAAGAAIVMSIALGTLVYR